MNRHLKYLLLTLLFACSATILWSIPTEEAFYVSEDASSIADLEGDSLPRFPVKKTQIKTYEDLNSINPIDLKEPSNISTSVEYDINSGLYIYKTKLGTQVISTPFSLSPNEYLQHTLKESMNQYFLRKNRLGEDGKVKEDKFALKDVKISMSPTDRLFGPGGLRFTANGYVELTMGLKQTNIDNPTMSPRQRKRTIFEFKEDVQLNVDASLGDRLTFGMNYDTKSMFDFDSKRVNLSYDGDEDAVLQHISAGNVSMATTNSLINGGSALFGINTELQFGKLRVNAIISQQESEARTISTDGGVQVNNYEFKVDKYDENRHFFLTHYFRDNYDKAMAKLPFAQSPVSITRIEVWITNKRGDYTQSRNILAFADIAEYNQIKNGKWSPSGSTDMPHNGANTLYQTIVNNYPAVRDISQVSSTFSGQLDNGLDYEKVENARLLNQSEYYYNPQIGYLSLNSALQADEVLAVAFEYQANGKTYRVGEFAADILDKYNASNPKSGSLFLKLLKPVSLSPIAYTWDLMMKNVYSLGASGIQKDKFRLNIAYQSDTLGTYINYLPEGKIKNELLLKVMNLDRLDSRENTNPDGIFDYLEGYTINQQYGRIYFPVVEPFGTHLYKKIDNSTIAEKYVYQQLYDSTKTVAQQIAEKNKFKIFGTYRGSSADSDINLNATNVPQGSVNVTAGGVKLVEGTDYIVDYMSGNVTIINQDVLESNIPVQVSLEDRTFSMQRKTLMGLNLSYDISKKLNVGGTIMHYFEKPLTNKVEFGQESAKNTLWGLNASYKTESQLLTNLIDKIPFVNATQPSRLAVETEFAQLIAGHYVNNEIGAYSYLDDFESSQSKIDIKSPYAWTLAATPAGDPADPFKGRSNELDYGMHRAAISWFMIDQLFTRKGSSLMPQHIKNDLPQLSSHFIREINYREIYPNKDLAFNQSSILPVLNISYYPEERGAYNLDGSNVNSDGNLLKPETRWGGITRKMDVRDFEASNIEYLEFWLMDPFVYNSDPGKIPNEGGDLYINLGEISEDILKDGKKFFENGLPIDNDPAATEETIWGKVPTRQSTVYAFDNNQGDEGRKRQDVGLNGLSTEDEFNFKSYTDYLANYKSELSSAAIQRLSEDQFSPLNDPAGDNYHFYRGSDFDREEVSVLNRYKRYNATEGNSPSSSDNNESYSTASRSLPDVEDIDQDNTLNEHEAYYEYKIELKPSRMKVGDDNYIVDSREVIVDLANGEKGKVTWYQFKVPVRSGERRGSIQNFKSIRFMRMYLTGFKQNTFLRFGTLQLVRGDWRVYEQTLNKNDAPSSSGTIDVSTVNIEENGNRTPVNYVLPPGIKRVTDPDQTQLTQENEQSLAMRVIDLESGDAKAIYKNVIYDLRRYKRLQLFTHAEELIGGPNIGRGEITVFLRLGSDYKNNYYEYEIPMTITPHGIYSQMNDKDRETVWPEANMFDFALDILKNLKLERNRESRIDPTNVSFRKAYSGFDPDKPMNRISVKGNPSLSDVNVMMIGIRNDSRNSTSAEVWINELRLSDFDDRGGWAARGSVNLALSDVATINFAGRKETAGFGALDQSLSERRQDDYSMINFSSNVDIGRFIPEKIKLSMPFYYSYSNETITPEYDPYDQDVKLKEALSILDTRQARDSVKSLALDKTTNKSISFNNVRFNIRSETPMPYDPANFTFGYVFNETEIRNPSTAYDVNKNYKVLFNYTYSPIVKTWEPFKNIKGGSGASRFLKSLGFNYIPNNISFNSLITRHYSEVLTRDIEGYNPHEIEGGPNTFLHWSQEFYWDRDFNLNWDFTKNLKFTFQSGTRAEIEEPYLQVNKKLNRGDYEIWRDSVWQSIRRLGNPLEYRQNASLNYQVPFRYIPALSWANSVLNYSSGYQWDRGAYIEDVEMGNTISNNLTLESKNRFNLEGLYNKFSYLKRVNDRFSGRSQQQPITQRERQRQEQEKRVRKYTDKTTLSTQEKVIVKHNLATKKLDVSAKKDGKRYELIYKTIDENTIEINNKDSGLVELSILSKIKKPIPKIWSDVGAYSTRALMSIHSVSFNYSKRKETHIAGYREHIGNAFGQRDSEFGLAPGLGFAFGLDGGEDFIYKALRRDWLVMNTESISPAVFNNAEKLEFQMRLEPFTGLIIDLKAHRESNKRTDLQYMYPGMPRTLGGSFSMSIIALSSSMESSSAKKGYYSKSFETFLDNRQIIKDRLEAKYTGKQYPSGGFMDENTHIVGEYDPRHGDVNINSGDVLIPAFLAAYTGGSVKKVSLSAFPSLLKMLPNWKISYDGLTKIPVISKYFTSIRFNHSYEAMYQISSYGSHTEWLESEDDFGFIRDVVNGNPVPSSPYNFQSVDIVESFYPFFGAEVVLKNKMTFTTQYNRARTVSLNLSSYQIIEALQREFVVGFGYRIDEFNRLIRLTDKRASDTFNNSLNIKADFSYRINEALIRKIEERFTQATSGTSITTLKLSADYAFSRAFTLRAFFDRIMNKPLITSNGYPTSNNNFGLSVKFTLTQ